MVTSLLSDENEVVQIAKESARGGYYLFVGNTLSTGILTVASIIIARLLGPNDYGLFSLTIAVPSLFIGLVDFGITSAITRFSFFNWRFKFLLWPLLFLFYIRKERFDIIHAHSIFPAATAGLAGKIFHMPILVTSHGGDFQIQQNIGYGARLNPIALAFISITLKFVDKLVVVSEELRNIAYSAGADLEKIVIIPNFIDTAKVKVGNGNLILKRYNLEKGKYLVYIGRLTPEKGLLQLIKSLEQVLIENNELKLVIAGYGVERSKLENYVKARSIDRKVVFTGVIMGEEKWDLYACSLAFIIPSTTEAFGIAAIEAMASGTVVIARNKPPFCEYIKNGVTGVLVNDLADIKSVIKELANNREKRLRIAKEGKRCVSEKFSLNIICSEYEKLYAEILKRSGLH